MKNKKAFTLIELLAIIVILAIIAVITVPIILNIIENAKKGAATNSAYGYKDAIQKFYASKLTRDSDYDIPDGLHTKSDFDAMGVLVNGKQPGSNSFLKIAKNMVTSGCLQFDEYKVEFVDGKVINAVKGECKTVNVVYTDVNENGKIDLADTVKIENDDFYILAEPSGGKVKLLPKYNLNSSSRQASSNTIALTLSNTDYWSNNLSNYPIDKYDTYYVYTRDTSNNMYGYIENYKNYLIELGAYFVTDARLMSFEEAKNAGCRTNKDDSPSNSCPSFFGNETFWLGSVNGTTNPGWLYYYIGSSKYLYPGNGASQTYRVRPVIEIYESAISNNYTLTFDSRGGSEVAPKTIVTGDKAGTLPTNPTKEGAVFEGWYTDKEYTSEKLTSDTVPIGSTTYYARYVLSKAEYTDSDESGTINLGDSVKIFDDYFYVIAEPSGGKVKLLPKYNLNYNSRQENGHNPSIEFASSEYWKSNSGNYNLDSYDIRYVYRTKDNEDTENNLKPYINNYKDYLYRQGAEFVTDARLMSFEDLRATGCKWFQDSSPNNSCPSYVANQMYWSGSVRSNNWLYITAPSYRYLSSAPVDNNPKGIRPLIEVNESALQ